MGVFVFYKILRDYEKAIKKTLKTYSTNSAPPHPLLAKALSTLTILEIKGVTRERMGKIERID